MKSIALNPRHVVLAPEDRTRNLAQQEVLKQHTATRVQELVNNDAFIDGLVEVLLTSGVHEVMWHKTPVARLGSHVGKVDADTMRRGIVRLMTTALDAPGVRWAREEVLDGDNVTSNTASMVWLAAFPKTASARRELNGGE
jgi:hypothetical protein